ncbi:uncharacterized protein LOC120838538 [Ixodes scapularis]|uniref:uncharacterized protein LOC120838538 n=1 Tax=Ixodes scapularis TaxID=6945 RepID=UPI001A9F436E|nr:uncharacterized protein LOC120838538 [Ixodes scapularis]
MKPCRGVKGVSILLLLAFFKFPTGFVVDYMHAVCSGFVKYTACMWFDCKSSFPFSLGNKVSDVNQRLLSLQPIHEISRLPRSLVHRKYWKSSEWRNWLLYFSPLVLKGILPAPYYRNWIKFVQLIHFLLMEPVPSDKLKALGQRMKVFLKEFEELYGKKHLTYNAHLLLHLVDSVKEWGPLWNYSAYPFESMNGRIVKLVNGPRYAQWQIVEKILILSALPKLCSSFTYFTLSPMKGLMTSLVKRYKLRRFSRTLSGCVFHGKGKVLADGTSFSKATINGVMFCVESRDKSRRLNSYVEGVGHGNSRVFGRIVSIRLNMCEHGSGHCEKWISFFIRELRVTSAGLLDLSPLCNFFCVEPKAHIFSSERIFCEKVCRIEG